jgi:hypothetical protein
MQQRSGLTRAYGALAMVFAGLVVLQVFFAGLGIFGAESFDTHRSFGNVLHALTAILLLLAVLGPRTTRDIAMAAGLVVLTTIQIGLVGAQDDALGVAALHPVLALLVLGLAVHMGAQALRGRRSPRAAA